MADKTAPQTTELKIGQNVRVPGWHYGVVIAVNPNIYMARVKMDDFVYWYKFSEIQKVGSSA